MAVKRVSGKPKSDRIFGQTRKPAKMFRAGLYARVSTNDQQTIPNCIALASPKPRSPGGYRSAGRQFVESKTRYAADLSQCRRKLTVSHQAASTNRGLDESCWLSQRRRRNQPISQLKTKPEPERKLIRLHRREEQVQPNHEASREEREWHRQEPLLPRAQPLQPVLGPLKLF